MPPLFEKTKQEIKLKIADLRKEELLEVNNSTFLGDLTLPFRC